MSDFKIVKLLDPIQMSINGTFNPMGAYNGATDYAVGDQVDYNGSSYIMYNNAAAGTVPTNTSYWGLVASKGDTGATGADSTVPGPAGADGIDGLDGKTILNGTVDPTTEGVDGDFYINTVSNEIFGPKAGTWGTGTSIVGPAGADGTTPDLSTYQLKPSEGAFANGDKTKLDGIEALADVTDATNVASAGAVMDGDFSTSGVMTRTAAGTYTSRTITGTTNQITVTNGDGVSGNPTLSLPQDIHTGATPQFTGLTTTGNINPTTDSARTLGTSALYWSNTYTDRLYLNSTVYLDGTTTGIAEVAGAISGSTSLLNAGNFTYNGGGSFINYNGGTAFNQRQSGVYVAIANSFAGTRSNRLSGFDFNVLNSVSQTASALYGAFGQVTANAKSSVITAGAGFSSQLSLQNQASMSIGSYFGVQPQAITSNLAGANTMTITSYGGISIPAQAAVTNLTITTQYGLLIGNLTGATTNYAIYTGTGLVRFGDVMLPVQATTAGAPAYVKGGIYFDTTLNKLRVGGATAWETITSV